MNFNYKPKDLNKNEVTNNQNKNKEIQEQDYSYYSNVLKKPFNTVDALKDAEAAYYAAIKAKEDKASQKKTDAKIVEDAFKMLNAARKTYKESITGLTNRYTHALKDLKTAFEQDKIKAEKALAKAEEDYSAALKAFNDKYPEGYHLTLKDGDFETTISSQSATNNKAYTINTIGEILDLLFKF